MKRLLRVSEFAHAASLSEKTVYRRALSGEFPSVRLGRQVRIPSWFLDEICKRPGELAKWKGFSG